MLGLQRTFKKKRCRVWLVIWYSSDCFARRSTCRLLFFRNPDHSEVWEWALYENFGSSYLRNRKAFSLIFSPIFSKSVPAFKLLRRSANLRKVEPRMNFPFRKCYMKSSFYTAHKIKSSINYLFSKCDQIRWKREKLLKKYLMENFIFCAVWVVFSNYNEIILKWMNVV